MASRQLKQSVSDRMPSAKDKTVGRTLATRRFPNWCASVSFVLRLLEREDFETCQEIHSVNIVLSPLVVTKRGEEIILYLGQCVFAAVRKCAPLGHKLRKDW